MFIDENECGPGKERTVADTGGRAEGRDQGGEARVASRMKGDGQRTENKKPALGRF